MRRVDEVFKCETCGKEYNREADYDKCVLSHDIVFIGLERAEWKKVMLTLAAAAAAGVFLEETIMRKFNKYKIGVRL